MWDPEKDTGIEEAVTQANNLNELLDLMHLCFRKMNSCQTEALIGLALNMSSDILPGLAKRKSGVKINLIETRRRHLVRAKLDSMMRRTGSYFQIVELEDGTTLPVELDEDILTKALIKLFEAMIYDNHKREQAEHLIAEHYSNCMGVNKLTPDGVDFMNALIATLAEQSLKAEESING
ncbi:Uncharacterised protein [Klebsiella quasipneumoniae]|uniref:hypothetical protein n=1 Tax=Klebsiella quasipneumoniae TaxID=1463165 RepID=UPI002270D6ED|nr:hypothetical protein [Klebsiella quasipneumoniae]CAH1457838.1 Uncharacterised protein [Klebsiella quasipneumoniae]CAH1473212.1 Uncharacterised protein [Klebsiella quasipneumoniae]